jgi:Tol biopolymer transport system component
MIHSTSAGPCSGSGSLCRIAAIVDTEVAPSNARLMVAPLSGGEPVIIETGSFSYPGVSFSPSAEWVAFSSRDTGVQEIYVKSLMGGPNPKIRISRSGGINPVWNRSQTELYYAARMVASWDRK